MASSGNIIRATRSRRSLAASVISVPHVKETLTLEFPSLDVELTSSTFWTVLTARSTGSVINVSTSFGEAPEYDVDTVNDGNSISGSRSIANLDSENTPIIRIAMKTIKVVIGFLMAMSDRFMLFPSFSITFLSSRPLSSTGQSN